MPDVVVEVAMLFAKVFQSNPVHSEAYILNIFHKNVLQNTKGIFISAVIHELPSIIRTVNISKTNPWHS